MNRLFELFRNKYFVATAAFLVWMLFFDKNDMLSQYEYRSEVNKLQEEKDFYEKETDQVKKDLKELSTNLKSAEKFAREKYFMKKDNEDVFVIVKEAKKRLINLLQCPGVIPHRIYCLHFLHFQTRPFRHVPR